MPPVVMQTEVKASVTFFQPFVIVFLQSRTENILKPENKSTLRKFTAASGGSPWVSARPLRLLQQLLIRIKRCHHRDVFDPVKSD